MSSSEVIIRQVGPQDLDTFQQRIVQIFLDAFTTDGFAFNAQRATEAKAISYLRSLFAHSGVAFFAFDSGRIAYPYYPIAFLFGSTLSSDPLLSQTPIADAYDVTQCGYIAEVRVRDKAVLLLFSTVTRRTKACRRVLTPSVRHSKNHFPACHE